MNISRLFPEIMNANNFSFLASFNSNSSDGGQLYLNMISDYEVILKHA